MAERVEAAAGDEYTQDDTVDLRGNPVLRSKRGGWKACGFVVGPSLLHASDGARALVQGPVSATVHNTCTDKSGSTLTSGRTASKHSTRFSLHHCLFKISATSSKRVVQYICMGSV